MEKYEFRSKQPLWVWIPVVIIIMCVLVNAWMTAKYELLVIWLIYAGLTFMMSNYTYVVTPDAFVLKPSWGKKRKFLLKEITEIERKYSKKSELKSIIIRYRTDKMNHNFFEIKGNVVNIKAVLEAIQDYYPAVPVH